MYICYLITNNYKTYIGSTNNFLKRIRQHNGEISGGAKYTTNFKNDIDWYPIMLIGGFEKTTALSFEWRMKRSLNKFGKLKPNSGINKRVKNIFEIILSDKITNNAPLISTLEFTVWINNSIKDKITNENLKLNLTNLPKNIKIDFFNFDEYKEISLKISNGNNGNE